HRLVAADADIQIGRSTVAIAVAHHVGKALRQLPAGAEAQVAFRGEVELPDIVAIQVNLQGPGCGSERQLGGRGIEVPNGGTSPAHLDAVAGLVEAEGLAIDADRLDTPKTVGAQAVVDQNVTRDTAAQVGQVQQRFG